MLINCLFYSLEDGLLSFRREKNIQFQGTWVPGEVSFNETKGKSLGLADGHFYVKNSKDEVFCSTTDIGLNYSTRINLGHGRLLYRIYSLKSELRLQIQIEGNEEKSLRHLLKAHCILVSERSALSSFEPLSQNALAQNCHCSSTETIYQNEKFFAKVFDKAQLMSQKTDLVLYTSVKRLREVPDDLKLDLVQMLETSEQFIMLFAEGSDMISLHQYSSFLNNNCYDEVETLNQLILLRLLEAMMDLEKKTVCFPFIDPKDVLINANILDIRKLSLKTIALGRKGPNSHTNPSVEARPSGLVKQFLTTASSKSSRPQIISWKKYQESKDLIKIRLVGTEFLTHWPSADPKSARKFNFELGTATLMSNLFPDLSKSLNAVNAGLVFVFLLTGQSFCLSDKDFFGKQSKSICVNFPMTLLKRCSDLTMLAIRRIFETKSLEDIYSYISRMLTYHNDDKRPYDTLSSNCSFSFTSVESIRNPQKHRNQPGLKPSFQEDKAQNNVVSPESSLTQVSDNHNNENSSELLDESSVDESPFENKDARIFGLLFRNTKSTNPIQNN